MDYLFGFLPGFFVGIGLAFFYTHKSEISYMVTCMKEDLTAIQIKLDRLINKLP